MRHLHLFTDITYTTPPVFIIINVQYSFARAHHYIDPQTIYFTPHTHLGHTDTERGKCPKKHGFVLFICSVDVILHN